MVNCDKRALLTLVCVLVCIELVCAGWSTSRSSATTTRRSWSIFSRTTTPRSRITTTTRKRLPNADHAALSYGTTTRRPISSSRYNATTRKPAFNHSSHGIGFTTPRPSAWTTTQRYVPQNPSAPLLEPTFHTTSRPPIYAPQPGFHTPRPSAPVYEPVAPAKTIGWQENVGGGGHRPYPTQTAGFINPAQRPLPYPTQVPGFVVPNQPPPHGWLPPPGPTYSNIPAPTVRYPDPTQPPRHWTHTTRRHFWKITTLAPPIKVVKPQSLPPAPAPQYPYPGYVPTYTAPNYGGFGGYPTGGGSMFGFPGGNYGMQKENKGFFHSTAATVGTVFAGLAVWELVRNRNQYNVYTGGHTVKTGSFVFHEATDKTAISPGRMYFVTPKENECNVKEMKTSARVKFTINCNATESFNATVILPGNTTAKIPCEVQRKPDGMPIEQYWQPDASVLFPCTGHVLLNREVLKTVEYEVADDTNAYTILYNFCDAAMMDMIVRKVIADRLHPETAQNISFPCTIPFPHVNPFQPFHGVPFYPPAGNPYVPFGYLYPPPYLPPGYSFCNASVMDMELKPPNNTSNNNGSTTNQLLLSNIPLNGTIMITAVNGTITNISLNKTDINVTTESNRLVLPCVPLNPAMYTAVPDSHPFYKTKYNFCNASVMELVMKRQAFVGTNFSSIARNDTANVTFAVVNSTNAIQNRTWGTLMCVPPAQTGYIYPPDTYPFLPIFGDPQPNLPSQFDPLMVNLIPKNYKVSTTTSPPPMKVTPRDKNKPADHMKNSLKTLSTLDMKTVRVLANSTFLGPLFQVLRI